MAWPCPRAKFARHAGVSAQAVSKASKDGGPLEAAVLPSGDIDLDHEDARGYIKSKGRRLPQRGLNDPPMALPNEPPPGAPWPPPDGPGSNDDLQDLASYLHPLIIRFGGGANGLSPEEFADWVDTLKKIEETIERRIKNDKARRDLIERSIVVRIFDEVARAIRNVVTDVPTAIVIENRAQVANGTTTEDAIAATRRILSGEMRAALDNAARMLRDVDR